MLGGIMVSWKGKAWLAGMWIRAFFSRKLPSILRGNANRLLGREERLYRERMRKCGKCSEALLAEGIGFICGICGCPLESKLRDPMSECGKGEWGKKGNDRMTMI